MSKYVTAEERVAAFKRMKTRPENQVSARTKKRMTTSEIVCT